MNFVPLAQVGGTAYGMFGTGPAAYTMQGMLSSACLNDEFADALPSSVIEDVSARLQREATWWIPVPSESSSDSSDLAGGARVALERVQADLQRVDDANRVGPGHNQGPTLDPTIAAEIREQVRLGIEATGAGAIGKAAGNSAANALLTLAGSVGSAFVQGAAKEAGKDAYPLLKHGIAVLLDHMLQAAAALAHWVASIPPGPLF